MGNHIQTVEQFVAAFNAKDVDRIMGFFTPDAVYHNMPMAPAEGTEAIRALIEFFLSPAETVDWEILSIAQAGDTVLAERIDRFVMDGKECALPVVGVFEMREGKIAAWREYFDMATWQRQAEG